MKTKYSEYSNHKIILTDKARHFSVLPQVIEYGYITGCAGVPFPGSMYFQNKLEFCIRISCSKDTLIHTVNGVTYKNSYPHCLIKPPLGEYHVPGTTLRDIFYILYPPEMFDFFKKTGIIDDTMCWDIELTPNIVHLITLLKEMMSTPLQTGFADQVDLRCLQLLEQLSLLRKKKDTFYPSSTENINHIISYFNMHYCDQFSLDELIEVNGFSRSSFFRYWRRYYKISPAKYMMQLRIAEAKRLLSETNSSIDEITLILKFNSPTYFCSVFKKLCNCTPLQYRKLKRTNIK